MGELHVEQLGSRITDLGWVPETVHDAAHKTRRHPPACKYTACRSSRLLPLQPGQPGGHAAGQQGDRHRFVPGCPTAGPVGQVDAERADGCFHPVD